MCPQDLSVLVALSSSPLVCTFHILVFFIRKISPLKVVDVLQTKPMPFFNIKFITLHCISKCHKFTTPNVLPLARQAIYCPRASVFQMSPPRWTNPTGSWASVLSSPHKIIAGARQRVPVLVRTPIHFWPVSGANCTVSYGHSNCMRSLRRCVGEETMSRIEGSPNDK